MPRITKQEASHVESLEGFEGRYQEFGPYTVGFESYSMDADVADLFRGLPDDRCQCSHWGVVLRGQLTFRYADHDEVVRAGDAYYAPPGHTPVLAKDTEVIEFSPTQELARTMEVVMGNLQAAGAAE